MTTIHTIEVPHTSSKKKQEDNGFILTLILALLVLVGAAIAFAPANPNTIDTDARWIVGP
jgi:hypothetical protein